MHCWTYENGEILTSNGTRDAVWNNDVTSLLSSKKKLEVVYYSFGISRKNLQVLFKTA